MRVRSREQKIALNRIIHFNLSVKSAHFFFFVDLVKIKCSPVFIKIKPVCPELMA